jgi:hypothetical protein
MEKPDACSSKNKYRRLNQCRRRKLDSSDRKLIRGGLVWEDNIRTDLRENGGEVWTGCRYGPMAGSCEYGEEFLD